MTKIRLDNLVDDQELLVEESFSTMLSMLCNRRILGTCSREKAPSIDDTRGFSVRLKNTSVHIDGSFHKKNFNRLAAICSLVGHAKTGEIKILHRSEIQSPFRVVRLTDGGSASPQDDAPVAECREKASPSVYYVAAHANDDWSPPNESLKSVEEAFSRRPLMTRHPAILAAENLDFGAPALMIGGKYFTIQFAPRAGSMRIIVGEEIMDPSTLTVRAIIGTIKVPIGDLVKLRAGSTFNLGNLSSLEAIFEVEGAPYATGRISVLESGEVQVETKEFL